MLNIKRKLSLIAFGTYNMCKTSNIIATKADRDGLLVNGIIQYYIIIIPFIE